MSKINRSEIKKLILKEMRMLGMADMDMLSDPAPQRGCDSYDEDQHDAGHEAHSEMPAVHGKGTVSREDCCAAVLCLIECCECPATRRELERCCADLMSGMHDS
tara:strand:- start:2937 stop:3248 length:312 start_codon:yes stop_codon:yes gene_type:complete